MTDKNPETDRSAVQFGEPRIDARRRFDREVLVEVVAELKVMMEDQDKKLNVQAENIRSLELKLAELIGANDLRSGEDRHTSVKLAEHQLAIAELRRLINVENAKIIDLPRTLQRRGLN